MGKNYTNIIKKKYIQKKNKYEKGIYMEKKYKNRYREKIYINKKLFYKKNIYIEKKI